MKNHNLLLVAHPDDETLFFGGTLQVYRRRPWKVVCVTDGNADGHGEKRRQEFHSACRELQVETSEVWHYPDLFDQRLDVESLTARLRDEAPDEVFTHGPLGEYGHPHHQDVSLAAHRAFQGRAPIWSVAYNAFAERIYQLSLDAYMRKAEVLSRIYFGETRRFARWLPAHSFEGFLRVELKEVEALHRFLYEGTLPNVTDLRAFAWFHPYLEEFRRQTLQRPF
ncbi:MAG: PIG-L family deacetylase [Bdellovibrionales bacterium]